MRILLVAHGLPPAAAGGTEIYTDALARALGQAPGDEVLVLAREADASRPELAERHESRAGYSAAFINHNFRDARAFTDSYRHPGIARRAQALLDRWRPDVVHIQHLTGLGIDLLDELAARRLPTLFTLNDYWLICHRGQLLDRGLERCPGPLPDGCRRCLGIEAMTSAPGAAELARRLPARLLALLRPHLFHAPDLEAASARASLARAAAIRSALTGVDRFLAPSRTLAERFLGFGIAPGCLHATTQGIDLAPLEAVARERRPSARLRLGFLGSLMVSKAPHLLLEAAARLPAERIELHVFGAHADYHGDPSYRQLLAPLLAAPGVRWHGALGRERIGEAFAAIDVLVIPSIWLENAPFVIREAFAAGCPVVASDLGGMAEMVEEGVSGLRFAPGDATDLARVLRRLLDEPALLPRLRSGLPPVKSIAEDAVSLRAHYATVVAARAATTKPMPLAAIVLNHETPSETWLTLRSLAVSGRRPDRTYVVDNGSEPGARAQLAAILPAHVTGIDSPHNLGFSGGMNLGIRAALAAGAERLLLLNSDVWLPPSAIARLEAALDRDPTLGIAGPTVLMRHDPARIASAGMRWWPHSGRMRQTGFRELAERMVPADSPPEGLIGCALLVRRAVFDAIGLLDEDYFFSFEDLDLCLRAREAGFGVALVPQANVLHAGGATLAPQAPARIYFATRNHLRLALLRAPLPQPQAAARAVAIAGYNLAHVLLTAGVPRPAGLVAWARGIGDHVRGRYGPGSKGVR